MPDPQINEPSPTAPLDPRLQAEFIRQEHRLFHILRNSWEYASADHTDPRRQAARTALLYRVCLALLPTAAVAGAGIVGLLALYFSWQANSLTRNHNDIIQAEYKQARSIVLKGHFADDKKAVVVAPIASAFTILDLSIVEPSEITSDRILFDRPLPFSESGPDWNVSLEGIERTLVRNYLTAYMDEDKGNVMTITTVPVIVNTAFVTKGERFNDSSVYEIHYALYHEVDTRFIFVIFDAFGFIRRLSTQEARILQEMPDDSQFILSHKAAMMRMFDTKEYSTIAGDGRYIGGIRYTVDNTDGRRTITLTRDK